MEKEILCGDYSIVLDSYSTGHFVSYKVYYKGVCFRTGGGYSEVEALSDANEWISIDMKERHKRETL